MMARGTARMALGAYFGVLVPLVTVFSVLAIAQPSQTLWIYALMGVPAASALLAWAISGVRPRFGRFGWRSLLYPVGLIAVVSMGYLVGGQIGVLTSDGVLPDGAGIVGGVLPSIALAFGEELGWRGYLLPQLRRVMGFWAANAIVVAVWAIYHLPIIVWGVYAPADRPLGVAVLWFLVNIALFSFTIGALWEVTHDVWMAAIAHGLWNVFIADVFVGLYLGSEPWLLGEFGLIPATPLVIAFLVSLWLSRGRRPSRLDLAPHPALSPAAQR